MLSSSFFSAGCITRAKLSGRWFTNWSISASHSSDLRAGWFARTQVRGGRAGEFPGLLGTFGHQLRQRILHAFQHGQRGAEFALIHENLYNPLFQFAAALVGVCEAHGSEKRRHDVEGQKGVVARFNVLLQFL